jgi:hypothetical protein
LTVRGDSSLELVQRRRSICASGSNQSTAAGADRPLPGIANPLLVIREAIAYLLRLIQTAQREQGFDFVALAANGAGRMPGRPTVALAQGLEVPIRLGRVPGAERGLASA